MARSKRPLKEIVDDLERLKETKLEDRDRIALVHEISVYQEELIVQNEALTRAQSALEETRDRFIELYDFAPVGYVVLDRHGVITQCNVTAGALLNRDPRRMERLPLIGFVSLESRRQYADFLRRCRDDAASEVSVEAVLYNGERRIDAVLTCRPRVGSSKIGELLTSIVDITARKQLERQVARAAVEHGALAAHLLGAIDDERKRIARNLHDDLGQQVTAIRLKMAAVSVEEPLSPLMDSVKRMIEDLDQRLHFVATDLRPPSLDLGLVSAVRQHVHRWSATFKVPVDVRVDAVEDGWIDAVTETHMFRIIQEALNNVGKHAAAKRVTVTIKEEAGELALVVEDDGRGFDLAASHARIALGIIGMRERANLVGGRLQIDSAPGRGTSVFVRAPVSRAL